MDLEVLGLRRAGRLGPANTRAFTATAVTPRSRGRRRATGPQSDDEAAEARPGRGPGRGPRRPGGRIWTGTYEPDGLSPVGHRPTAARRPERFSPWPATCVPGGK